MINKKTIIAVFGLGRIGLMHVENLSNHKDFSLKYVFDINKYLTKKVSKKYNCKAIFNPKFVFEDNSVDTIFIATATLTHIKYIIESVKNKKIVFCEKPLDLNLKKINQCKKIIEKYNPKIQLGFNRRYDPGHNSIKKDLIKNKIGKLEKIIITSRDPAPPSKQYLKSSGGIFKDMMIHDFDLARFYIENDDFISVFATGSKMYDKKFKTLNDFELATSVLKTRKGIQCIITNSRHCSFGYDQRVELFGTQGMLISDNVKKDETSIYSSKNTSSRSVLKNFFIDRYSNAYLRQLDDLHKMKDKTFKPLAGFEDGRKSLILAETAIKSSKSKKFEKVKY